MTAPFFEKRAAPSARPKAAPESSARKYVITGAGRDKLQPQCVLRRNRPRGAELPSWLIEKLRNPPPAGGGLHAFLFSCARQLHEHFPTAEAERVLYESAIGAEGIDQRRRQELLREVRDAVRNSKAVAWQSTGGRQNAFESQRRPDIEAESVQRAHAWAIPNRVARVCRMADAAAAGVAGLCDLRERSPVRVDESLNWDSDDWIDWLFPGAEWLCLAAGHPATARSRRRSEWYFASNQCDLIVPSPMTGPGGINLDGRRTHRCLDNTGPRRWLVIEFDVEEDGRTNMPIDDQARLHWHFRSVAAAAGWPPLRLCVHSAGKSLHGWYGPLKGADEASAFDLMFYASSLSADTSSWNRCQLMRLPGGLRGGGKSSERVGQKVMYFNPENYPQ